MLELKDVKKSDRWILTSFEVMKYNPIFRNVKGEYLKDEWTGYYIGDKFDGKVLTYSEYKQTEDKYIEAIAYLFGYYKCDKIQFISERFFLDDEEIKIIRDDKLELFYQLLKKRRILNIEEVEKASRLILRGAIQGRFYSKKNKDIFLRFGYDYYMYFNCLDPDKDKIRSYIEKNIGLFTHR